MPQITLAQQQNAGAVGGAFGAANAVLLTTTQVVTIPEGVWYVFPGGSAGGGATVDFSPDSGTTWRTIARGQADATRIGAVVYSDGYNTRLAQASSVSTTTSYYYKIRSF